MDFDSSSKFIQSLAKFLQSLCNGYVDFDKGVEVIGHIYINVDSDTGKKVDYVLNEKVCKNDNSITFISNSFHAQPAEKPKPIPKKAAEPEKQNEDTIVMEDSGQAVPNSTNVGTMGSFRNASPRAMSHEAAFVPGSKRPRTPPHRRNSGKHNSPAMKHGMPQSPRYQDSGGPAAKMVRSEITPSPLNNSNVGDDYESSNVFQSGEEDDSQNFSANFLEEQSASEIDQKPIIDPDISIVKEEYMSSQQSSCSYSGNSQTSGPGRGKNQQSSAYPVMIHPNPSNYSNAAASSHQSDSYSGSSLEGAGDPSTACLVKNSFAGFSHGQHKSHYGSYYKRRRSTIANHTYTQEEREAMGSYALIYGSTAAARHFSAMYQKRIPRESIKNFVTFFKKKQQQ